MEQQPRKGLVSSVGPGGFPFRVKRQHRPSAAGLVFSITPGMSVSKRREEDFSREEISQGVGLWRFLHFAKVLQLRYVGLGRTGRFPAGFRMS